MNAGCRPSLTLASLMIFSNMAMAEDAAPVINIEDSAIARANSVTIKPAEQEYIPADATGQASAMVTGASLQVKTETSLYRRMLHSKDKYYALSVPA